MPLIDSKGNGQDEDRGDKREKKNGNRKREGWKAGDMKNEGREGRTVKTNLGEGEETIKQGKGKAEEGET